MKGERITAEALGTPNSQTRDQKICVQDPESQDVTILTIR
jgi:hypothetical protein